MVKKEALKEVSTTRPGDGLLRRRRKSRKIVHTISRRIRRLIKGIAIR